MDQNTLIRALIFDNGSYTYMAAPRPHTIKVPLGASNGEDTPDRTERTLPSDGTTWSLSFRAPLVA